MSEAGRQTSPRMTQEEAILHLRTLREHEELIHNSYLGADIAEAAERFAASGEFAQVLRIVGPARARGATVLDLGAGNGIASYAFCKAGAARVCAVEPASSAEIGRGAIDRIKGNLPITVLDGVGERIPLPDACIDIVYTRQTLHHTSDMNQVLREAARVLRPGGIFFSCREHVVDNREQMRIFLRDHVVHQLAGTENAYSLPEYLGAIRRAGLDLRRVMGPWSTVINAFPAVRTQSELEDLPRRRLRERMGIIGEVVSIIPIARKAILARRNRCCDAGRMYSFLAVKPK